MPLCGITRDFICVWSGELRKKKRIAMINLLGNEFILRRCAQKQKLPHDLFITSSKIHPLWNSQCECVFFLLLCTRKSCCNSKIWMKNQNVCAISFIWWIVHWLDLGADLSLSCLIMNYYLFFWQLRNTKQMLYPLDLNAYISFTTGAWCERYHRNLFLNTFAIPPNPINRLSSTRMILQLQTSFVI